MLERSTIGTHFRYSPFSYLNQKKVRPLFRHTAHDHDEPVGPRLSQGGGVKSGLLCAVGWVCLFSRAFLPVCLITLGPASTCGAGTGSIPGWV